MIEVIILDKELYTPEDIAPKTLGSAGLDLKLTRAAMSATQVAGMGGAWPYHDHIGTGLKVRIPAGMVGLIVPRSSTGHKHGFRIGNTIGVIDSDYRGEIMLSVGAGDYAKMKRGYCCAQLIVMPYASFHYAAVVEEFSDTTARGDGGFGSTDSFSDQDIERRWEQLPLPGIGSTDPLPEQKLDILREFDHETAQIKYEEYVLATKNGGF